METELIEPKLKFRTENQKLNDLKMKHQHKVKREMKELHKLALRQVIAEDPELKALVLDQMVLSADHANLVNELGHLASKKRRGRPKRNSCIDSNLFTDDIIHPNHRESIKNEVHLHPAYGPVR